MKYEDAMMLELETELMKNINHCIMDLLSVKFGNQISKITEREIRGMIQHHLNETIWLDRMKENLNSFIFNYTKELESQKESLNMRMDHIEQQILNCMKVMEMSGLLIKSKNSFADILGIGHLA